MSCMFDLSLSLMGIVNVTPDSFSDGGRFLDPEAAVEHGLNLVANGARILDVGGESTRPGAVPVGEAEELARVIPVVERLCKATDVAISIDTSKAAVARAALAAGASIVNDVSGLERDPDMLGVIAASSCGVCLMHMRGCPSTMQDDPQYSDVVAVVKEYLARRRDLLVGAGVSLDRIAVDPGIGFGKTDDHNLELLRRVGELHTLGCRVLVGHSRKSLLGRILGDPGADRSAATVGVSVWLASQGVHILRVHDVGPTADAIAAYRAIAGPGTCLDRVP